MPRRLFNATLPMLAVFGLAQFGLAQPLVAAPSAPSLERLMQTKQYQADVFKLFSTLPTDVFQRCPALVSRDSQLTVIKPATFAANGLPTSGAWKQSFPVSGCGNATTINLYFTAQPGKPIAAMVGMPGDTHADPVLQRDAARDLMNAVHAKDAACADVHVRNTHYDGVPAPDTAGKGWRETWVVSACKQTYTVPLRFTPGAMGTQIAAEGGTVTTP